MKTSLDCIPCILRQTLDAARMVSADNAVHEQIIREVLRWTGEMDLSQSPPELAQRIHRRLREITGQSDPYRALKERTNQAALEMLPALRAEIAASSDPLITAARIAIAGNHIDMAIHSEITEQDVRQAMNQAFIDPFYSEAEKFHHFVETAQSIIYLTDNAGEIAFDRLLVEQWPLERVTLVVRGSPVINDATLEETRAVGLDQLVRVIDNGSDAPGTILSDCRFEVRQLIDTADLVIAKGQGNFESLSSYPANIFLLFKVKCPVAAEHIHQPVTTQVLAQSQSSPARYEFTANRG